MVNGSEFTHLHHESGLRSLYVYVLPLTGLLGLNVLMFWHGLPAMSRRWLWAGLGCHFITWVSSALIQIPLQLRLDQALDPIALHRLAATDWIRLSALLLLVGCNVMSIRPDGGRADFSGTGAATLNRRRAVSLHGSVFLLLGLPLDLALFLLRSYSAS